MANTIKIKRRVGGSGNLGALAVGELGVDIDDNNKLYVGTSAGNKLTALPTSGGTLSGTLNAAGIIASSIVHGTGLTSNSGLTVSSGDTVFQGSGGVDFNGGPVSFSATAHISSTVKFAAGSSGTLAKRTGYDDFIGYNASYGSYIGGGAGNAARYLAAGGSFYDGSTWRTLYHTGNLPQYLPLTGGTITNTSQPVLKTAYNADHYLGIGHHYIDLNFSSYTNDLELRTGGTPRLTIHRSTGNATFSGTLTATGGTLSGQLSITGDTNPNGQFLTTISNTGTQSEDNGLLVTTATNNASSNVLKVESTGNANTFIVKGNGNVGIGLSSGAITSKLHVNGGITSTGLSVAGSSSFQGAAFTSAITTSSNVSIATGTNKLLVLNPAISTGGSITSIAFQRGGTDKWRVFQYEADSKLSFYNDISSLHQLALNSDGSTTFGGTITATGGTLTGELTSRKVAPSANNTYSSGGANYRWSNVYSVAGDFSGNLTVAGSCTFAALSGTTATFSSDLTASGLTTLYTNSSGYALKIFENPSTGGEYFQIGVNQYGGLNFYNETVNAAEFYDTGEFVMHKNATVAGNNSATPLKIKGGTAAVPSIQLNGGNNEDDNSSIYAKYSLALGCNSSTVITNRSILFKNGTTELARFNSSGHFSVNSTDLSSYGHFGVAQPAGGVTDGIAVVNGTNSFRLWVDDAGNRRINAGSTSVVEFNPSSFNVYQPTTITKNDAYLLDLYRPTTGATNASFLSFDLNNDATSAERITYGLIGARIVDDTDGSEDGELVFRTTLNGTLATRMTLSQGGNLTTTGTITATGGTLSGALTGTTATFSGTITGHGSIDLQDNDKLLLGAGNDLEIYHDGSNNWIDANGVVNQDLYLRNLNSSGDVIVQSGASGDVYIKVNSGETALKATNNSAVELYYDGSKKFETHADGLRFPANQYILNSDNIKQIRFKNTEVCFNEDGRSDVDVRMEGDSNANLFFLDSSTDRIGIGTNAPAYTFHCVGTGYFSQAVLVKGADDNGGTADFSVATGGSTPQISWRSNGQVQIGSNDMNWNSKIFYDGATRFYTWANDIVLSAGHQDSGATGAYDIALYAATSNSTPDEYLRCDGSVGQVVLTKPLKVNNNAYIENTTYIDVPTNSGTASALIWRRLDHTIVGRIVADASNLRTQFWDDNSAVMTIAQDKLGILTTAPVTPLHVNSDGSANSIMSNQIVRVTPADGNNGLNIGSDGTDAMIGATNNDTSLHLLSRTGGVYSKALSVASNGNLTAHGNLTVSGDATIGSAATKLKTYSDSTYSGIYNGSSLASDEAVYFGNGGTFFICDGSEIMRLKTGRLGINQTSPAASIHTHASSGHNSVYITTDGNSSSTTALWFTHNYTAAGDWAGVIWGADDLFRLTASGSSTSNQFVLNKTGHLSLNSADLSGFGHFGVLQPAGGNTDGIAIVNANGNNSFRLYVDDAGMRRLNAGDTSVAQFNSTSFDFFKPVTLSGALTVGVNDTGHDVRFWGATAGKYWEWDESDNVVRMRDNVKSLYGDGGDLEIFHDGSGSYIKDDTTPIKLNSQIIGLMNATDNQKMVYATQGGSVELYHSGTKKFETTSAGATITGSLGVGTASPTSLLHCYKSAAGTSALFEANGTNVFIGLKESGGNFAYIGNDAGNMLFQTSGSSYSTKLAILTDGRIGIGTSAPISPLTVDGADGIYVRHTEHAGIAFDDTNIADGSTPITYISGDGGSLVLGRANRNSSTGRRTASSASITISNSGMVGIGLTPTNTALDVQQTSGNIFRCKGDSSNTRFSVGASGACTIEANTGNYPLHITNADSGDKGLKVEGITHLAGGVYDHGGDYGTNGQVLSTNGNGQVHWVANGSGGISKVTFHVKYKSTGTSVAGSSRGDGASGKVFFAGDEDWQNTNDDGRVKLRLQHDLGTEHLTTSILDVNGQIKGTNDYVDVGADAEIIVNAISDDIIELSFEDSNNGIANNANFRVTIIG